MMPVSADFRDFVKEGLEPLGHISHKRMFGGVGVYVDGKIIAIIVNDALYFKTDDDSRHNFVEAGSEPFSYEKKDGTVGVMTYFSAPEEVFDDPDEMVRWGRLGFEASLRAA